MNTTEITNMNTILELTVANHPGVMSHVMGLFARRAFNVDSIVCMPLLGNAGLSRIWLRVQEDRRLDQMIRQIEKLIDVSEVKRHGPGHEVFTAIAPYFE